MVKNKIVYIVEVFDDVYDFKYLIYEKLGLCAPLIKALLKNMNL